MTALQRVAELSQATVDQLLANDPGITTGMDANDVGFLGRCFQTPMTNYLSRLEAIEFRGKAAVLDAACGFGQWSLALGALNDTVVGVDIDPKRVEFCRRLATRLGFDGRAHYQTGTMDRLPFANDTFDLVFCYGAVMFCDERKLMPEFARVLKPGGRAYVMGTGLGLYLHYVLDRFLRQGKSYYLRGAMINVGNTLLNRRDRSHFSTRGRMTRALAGAGLDLVEFAAEGTINLTGQLIKPNYQGTYYGCLGVYEFIAQKRGK